MAIGFRDRISETLLAPLVSAGIKTLQVNAGYRCNMSCGHCHVNAGPSRDETMGEGTADAVLSVLKGNDISTLDITGGAPELSPHFRHLVTGAKKAGRHVKKGMNICLNSIMSGILR